SVPAPARPGPGTGAGPGPGQDHVRCRVCSAVESGAAAGAGPPRPLRPELPGVRCVRLAVLGEGGPGGGDGGCRAGVIGGEPAGVRDDPHVKHLLCVPVAPGGWVAAIAELDAEAGDGLVAVGADHQVGVPSGQSSADLRAVLVVTAHD